MALDSTSQRRLHRISWWSQSRGLRTRFVSCSSIRANDKSGLLFSADRAAKGRVNKQPIDQRVREVEVKPGTVVTIEDP